ncbi:sigma-70 family RNA polymerase sigma factor [bacterium]|nr:sigma-70 family RNA polymerase sigma factor [candidate division CSSED10-310 bacterium]
MNDTSSLLTAVAAGDLPAAQTLTERYAGPLFRFCRLNFTDHYRAGEFIEAFFADWISRLQKGVIAPGSILDIFREADRYSRNQWAGERGRGLSAKQCRILELMNGLPLDQRVALDLMYLEDRDVADVSRWLGIDAETIQSSATGFFKMLASDETIKEFLKHASIQQSRETKTRQQEDRPRSVGPEKRHGSSRQPAFGGNERSGWRGREATDTARGRPDTGSEKRGQPRDSDTGKNTVSDSGGGRKPTYEERQKSRARRRRVDPRQLDFEL